MKLKWKLKKYHLILIALVLLFVGIAYSPSPEQDLGEDGLPQTTQEVLQTEHASDTFDPENQTKENATGGAFETPQSGPQTKPESTKKPSGEDNSASLSANSDNLSSQKIDFSAIPPYSTSPFVILNDNKPGFTPSEITTTAFESYSDLDFLGRCGAAFACCGKEIMPGENEKRGSISSIKPSGWVQKQYDHISGKYLYNRCHLIGWQLSAENANRKNLITGTKYFNVEGMLPFENMIADYIKETNHHVMYRVTPIYQEDNLVASGVQLEAYSVEDSGEGICFHVYCYNVQPSVSIDYATGESRPAEDAATNATPPTTTTTPPTTTTTPPIATTTEQMVWIPTKGGTKYHSKSTCSNMIDPDYVSLSEAARRGFSQACKRCH